MTLFTDDFGRADATNLGANWEYQSSNASTSRITVTSGRARAAVTSAVLVRLVSGVGATTADQFSSITLVSGDGTAQAAHVRSAGTASGSTLTSYSVEHSADTVALRRNDPSGAATVLGSLSRTRTAGDRIAIVVQGSTVAGFVNGVEFARATDTTYSSGRPGFSTFGTTGVLLDDYAAGDYATDAAGRSDVPASLSGGGGATKAPNPATGLTAGTATTTTQPLTWTASVVDGTHDAAATYLVEYQVSGASTWTTGPTTSTSGATVTGLNPGTAYVYRVTAANAAGSAAPSSTVTASTLSGVVVVTNPANTSGLPTWRGLIHNPAGERIVAGELLHRLSADFFALDLVPTWLNAPEGTLGFNTDAGGAITLTTGATVGSRATLQLTRALPSTGIAAVHLELTGHRFSAASPSVDWRLFATNGVGGTAGASAVQLASEATVTLASGGESSRTATPQTAHSADAARRRPTGLLVSCATKEAWLFEGDSVIGYRDCASTWVDGNLNVGVSITAQSATAVELRLAALRCSVYV